MPTNEGHKAFVAYEDLEQARRVKIRADGVSVEYADADHPGHGLTTYPVKAGQRVTVTLFGTPGTHELTAAGALGIGVDAYAAADGKIQSLPVDAGDYIKIGVPHEAATADGDIIEAQPFGLGTIKTVSA